jgi:hypothetical protein
MQLSGEERDILNEIINTIQTGKEGDTPEQNEVRQSLAYKLKTLFVDDYEWYEGVADKLAKATGIHVTGLAIYGWCGPDGVDASTDEEYKQTDALVRRYLGDDLFEKGDDLARLSSVLEATLNGKNSVTIGGVTFKNLQKRRNAYAGHTEGDASRNF